MNDKELEEILAEGIYGIPYQDCDGGRRGMIEEVVPQLLAWRDEAVADAELHLLAELNITADFPEFEEKQ